MYFFYYILFNATCNEYQITNVAFQARSNVLKQFANILQSIILMLLP